MTKTLIDDGRNLDQNNDDSCRSKKLKRLLENEKDTSVLKKSANTLHLFPTARAFVRKVTSDALEDDRQPPQQRKKKNAERLLRQHAHDLQDRAKQGVIFGNDEKENNNDLATIEHSLLNLLPQQHSMDLGSLRELLRSVAHLSHKDWNVTERNAHQLHKILFYNANNNDDEQGRKNLGPLNRDVRQLLHRVLRDGNFDTAAAAASQSENHIPWAVLVTVCIVYIYKVSFFAEGISNELVLFHLFWMNFILFNIALRRVSSTF
jgi:hypothetical protein